MFEPSFIRISRSAYAANLAFVRQGLGDARLCSVVKGNAYGHGIKPFVHMAMEAGVDYFAVYSADEAYTLVSSLDRPVDVFIMGMVEGEGLEWAVANGVECCIHDHQRLEDAIRFAKRSKKKARLHVEVETGMHRTGFVSHELPSVLGTLKKNAAHVELTGLFTHFAGAESQVNHVRVAAQVAGFAEAYECFTTAGLGPRYAHQACSAAVLNYPATIGAMARVGILQYGFWPNPETWFRFHAAQGGVEDPLRRVISWHSSVMAITEVNAGGFIGYGNSCEASHPMRVAVVPVGYSHGFDRGLSNFGKVLVRGQQARITGIVNMNAISVDITGIEGVEKGDLVVLIGEQDGQRITVASFSEMSEQLNYEMLTRLPRDIPRTIIDRTTMAYLTLSREKLRKNHERLRAWFDGRGIAWGVVTKLLCGERRYLQELVDLGVTEMHDTRISNLKAIKAIAPQVQTVYIKPPAKRSIANVVRYADVSFNTDLFTIKALSDEAVKQGRIHKVIIMVEMGDLREGVMGDHLTDFYAHVFQLPGIEIIGIGTNLNCLNGIMPSADKLVQLSLYKQLIEVRFDRVIPWVSGGTTVTVPLLLNKELPKGVNHFRIGEALFFGADLFTGGVLPGMEADVFKLYAEVIELYEKPVVPTGVQKENPSGIVHAFDDSDRGRSTYRAILDIGLLDVQPNFLIPDDEQVNIIEASSDMLVVDLGASAQSYKVGDVMSFKLKYMGALGVMNSRYIDKVVE